MAVGDKRPVVMGAEKAAPNGVATLGDDGKLVEDQRPDATGMGAANRTLSNLTDPQTALYNLGAGVRPRLGINMDFKINQRGQDSYTASGKTYTVDGWYFGLTGGTLTVNSDGTITLGATNSTFWQLIPPDEFILGEPFTFSVLTSLGKLYSVTVDELSTNTDKIERTDFGLMHIQYYEGNIGVNINPSKAVTISCAKPEQGPDQTLAYQDADGSWKRLPQPDMDYGTQLAKCQRYLYMGPFEAVRHTRIYNLVCTPNQMRVTPSIIGTPEVRTIEANTIVDGASVTTHSLYNNQVILKISGSEEPSYVHFPKGTGLSAEL